MDALHRIISSLSSAAFLGRVPCLGRITVLDQSNVRFVHEPALHASCTHSRHFKGSTDHFMPICHRVGIQKHNVWSLGGGVWLMQGIWCGAMTRSAASGRIRSVA